MAKAKKRIATRKKSPKRGKASAKPARKTAAKRTTPNKAKSKVRRAAGIAPKPAAKKKPPPKIAATKPPKIAAAKPPKIAAAKPPRKAPRQVVKVPVEATIIDVIEEPVPGVVVVTEYESIRTGTPVSSDDEPDDDEPERGAGSETEDR
jgi:hypothetical protein